ncbi:unnamed protein product [Sphenostylis stenocarpa]|uniref:Uncharacterized protein n=1 Tax=Sphenostylis stenocarpa TaxID=92480 RepID=A0AA86VG18_9FABA|nr:unnamed protein product [Sphenostylis stenocarpa]
MARSCGGFQFPELQVQYSGNNLSHVTLDHTCKDKKIAKSLLLRCSSVNQQPAS